MAIDISGNWCGIYYYPSSYSTHFSHIEIPPVHFDAKIEQQGDSLRGQISEENTFAREAGAILISTLSGYVVGGIIGFEKSYCSGENAMHTIDYHGYITDAGQKISGHWQIDDYSGTFTMCRNATALKKAKKEELKVAANA